MRTALAAALASVAFGTPVALTAQAGVTDPVFVEAYVSGPLDSVYNAEYQRVQTTCQGEPTECYVAELDTTAVRLASVWTSPEATEPVGWLAARLRPQGRYPYAGLVFLESDGREVPLVDNVGDWGYGMTLDLVEARGQWIRPWLLQPAGDYWLNADAGPGFGVVEGPYGLEGRLWRLRPMRLPAGATGTDVLPEGVYMVLSAEDGVVRLRAEVYEDMPCGEPPDPAVDRATPTVHVLPLERLLDAAGRPTVATAYPKGC